MEEIIKFFTSTTGIVAALVVLLGLIGAAIGIVHKLNEIRKQRRELQKKEESSTPIKVELDTSRKPGNLRLANPEVEEFDWSEAKEIRFQLINDGEATAVVKAMKLVVCDCGPSNKLKMIRPGAPLSVYHYRVALDPDCKEYEIVSSLYTEEKPLFFYKTGEADSFLIKLSSNKAYWYEFSIVVEWYESTNPQEVKVVRSPKLRVECCIVQPEDIFEFLKRGNVN